MLITLAFLIAATAASAAEPTVHEVPASIDAGGKTEVSQALMKWLSALPKAAADAPAVVRFAKNGVYWVDYTLILRKHGSGSIPGVMWRDLPEFSLDHFRFDFNGATVEQRTKTPWKKGGAVADPRKRWGNPILDIHGATDVHIFGGSLRGACVEAVYRPALEEWTGIRITGHRVGGSVENIVVRDMTVEHVFGDFIYLASATTAGGELRNVRIENCTFRVAGRQGIVLNGGTGVLIKGCSFRETARFLFDSEPTAAQGWSDITIDSCTGTSGKLGFLQFAGPKAVTARNLTISNNTLTGGHFKIRLGNRDTESRRDGFTFTNNSTREGGNPFGGERKAAHLIEVTRWKNVTITGNTEHFELVDGKPLHSAVRLLDVENAKVEGNTWKNAVDGK